MTWTTKVVPLPNARQLELMNAFSYYGKHSGRGLGTLKSLASLTTIAYYVVEDW